MKRRIFTGVTLAALFALTGCGNDDPKPKAGADRKAV
ncbi:hypothetical protein GA0115254_116831 [Streptomyces sp. Ncost-T10-10d]|nr:hypothetical protein GA0115254_116831 [Streptomyces sp. Ncost-T10-10d]